MKIEEFIGIRVQFGARVRCLRNERNLTIEQLALKSNLNPRYLGEIERGKRNVSLENINLIANGLNVTLEELFKGLGLSI